MSSVILRWFLSSLGFGRSFGSWYGNSIITWLHAEPTGPTSYKLCETQLKATNDIFLLKESRTERRKLFPPQLQTEGKFKKVKSCVLLTDKDFNNIDNFNILLIMPIKYIAWFNYSFRWATRDSSLHSMYPVRLKKKANNWPSSSGNFRKTPSRKVALI